MAVQQLPNTLVSAVWPARADLEGRGLASGLRMVLLAIVGTALLTRLAKLNVPFYPVPMTMQTLVVLMLGAAYGWRLATATVVLYLVEGALGLPVFAGTPALGIGLPYMMGPTGGFLVGFVAGAALVGWLGERGLGRSFAGDGAGHAAGPRRDLRVRLWLAGHDRRPAGGLDGRRRAVLPRDALKTALGAALVPALWKLGPPPRLIE